MKRAATSWLVVLVLLVMVSVPVVLLVPMRPCPTCRRLKMPALGPVPASSGLWVPIKLNCPDCGDRGKVSLFRVWRGTRVSRKVLRMLEEESQGEFVDAYRSLVSMADAGGRDYEPLRRLEASAPRMTSRFIDAEGKTYLVCVLKAWEHWDTTHSGVALVTIDGAVLDLVHCGNFGPGRLDTEFVAPAGPDGALIKVLLRPSARTKNFGNCDVYHGDDVTHLLETAIPQSAPVEGVCRVSIRNGRFEILTPKKTP